MVLIPQTTSAPTLRAPWLWILLPVWRGIGRRTPCLPRHRAFGGCGSCVGCLGLDGKRSACMGACVGTFVTAVVVWPPLTFFSSKSS